MKKLTLASGGVTTHRKGEVSPNATLAQRLRQKDVRAFEQFYDRHSRIVYRLLLRIVQPAGTAEEVAQDAFLQLCAQGR